MRTLIFLFILSLTSCTMQKRVHLKGWNVRWNKRVTDKNVSSKEKKVVNLNLEKADYTDKDHSVVLEHLNDKSKSSNISSIDKTVSIDERTTQNVTDNRSTQLEDELIVSENPEFVTDKLKTNKELAPTSRITMFIILGSILIAAGILLFFYAANAAMVSATTFAIIGGVALATLGILIILSMVLLNQTNNMVN